MIIFDLDGTLADPTHRRHLVDRRYAVCKACNIPYSDHLTTRKEPCIECGSMARDRGFKPDWQQFFEECEHDKPIEPTRHLLEHLFYHGEEIHIWSGRCESVRQKTIDWINRHLGGMKRITDLKMRPIGNSSPDDFLKEQWLDELIATSCKTIHYVFDDRPKVVRMWRKRGIFVFNCNQNDEEF